MNTTTPMLRTKDQILQDNNINDTIEKYAEQNSLAFAQWRSHAAENINQRYKLDKPLPEQYQLFLKENGLL